MSEATLWKVVALLGLWVGLAALQTFVGRNDKKAWPTSWMATFCAWLVVGAPATGLLAVYWFATNQAPPLLVIIVWFLICGTVSWKWGAKLPGVGKWVVALRAREDERADKGLL